VVRTSRGLYLLLPCYDDSKLEVAMTDSEILKLVQDLAHGP